MKAFRILLLAGVLAAAGDAHAFPIAPALPGATVLPMQPVQVICGPYRCFVRPVWRYRSGAGFYPDRRFGFAPARPRFAPFGFRRFGGYGGYGGRPGGFRPGR